MSSNMTGLYECKTLESLKMAYHKQCLTHHPDKGGTDRSWKQLQTIFDECKTKLTSTKSRVHACAVQQPSQRACCECGALIINKASLCVTCTKSFTDALWKKERRNLKTF